MNNVPRFLDIHMANFFLLCMSFFQFLMRYKQIFSLSYVILKIAFISFGCHIDATEQQRALNFELVVSDQLFSVILVAYN